MSLFLFKNLLTSFSKTSLEAFECASINPDTANCHYNEFIHTTSLFNMGNFTDSLHFLLELLNKGDTTRSLCLNTKTFKVCMRLDGARQVIMMSSEA